MSMEKTVTRLDEIIRGNGEGIGLRAQVEFNSRFIKEMRFTSRTVLVLVLGDIVGRIMGLI